MKLLQNTLSGFRYKHWTLLETFTYFTKGVARELNIAPSFFLDVYLKVFKAKWLKKGADGKSYFDFAGAKLPDISDSQEKLSMLTPVSEDTFLFSCFFNDRYDKIVVEFMDQHMGEGPYGYTDGAFDVTVKKDDVVIDAGAWIGDFSAYAASKGAVSYAFEPVKDTFLILCNTMEMNNMRSGGIFPIQKGLGSSECEVNISIDENNSAGNSMTQKQGTQTEKVSITTLDKFVEENNLKRVDFIKADIEGAERDMLRGASHVLKTFAPKLAICTYHLPDDPEVLEKIIIEANPEYKVVHLRHKLLAAVI